MQPGPKPIKSARIQRDKTNTLRARVAEYLEFVMMTASPETHRKYKGVIHGFEKFIADRNIREIGAQAVVKYMLSLQSQGKSQTCIAGKKVILAGFFSWLVRMGYMEHNPASIIPSESMRSEPRDPPRAITEAEYQKLKIASTTSELHYAIICAWHTGMRLSDICQLKWRDVDFDRRVIAVLPIKTRKTGRRAIIPIHPELMEILAARHAAKLKQEAFVSEYLASKYVNRLGDIYSELSRIAESVGVKLGRRQRFHMFRHAAIRRWLESPVADAITVMSLSGHSSVQSLEKYSAPSLEKKRLIMGLSNESKDQNELEIGMGGGDRSHRRGGEAIAGVRRLLPQVAEAPRTIGRGDDAATKDAQ